MSPPARASPPPVSPPPPARGDPPALRRAPASRAAAVPQQAPARGALLLRERVGRLRGPSRRDRGEAEAERGGAQRESRQDRHGVASSAAGARPFSSAA